MVAAERAVVPVTRPLRYSGSLGTTKPSGQPTETRPRSGSVVPRGKPGGGIRNQLHLTSVGSLPVQRKLVAYSLREGEIVCTKMLQLQLSSLLSLSILDQFPRVCAVCSAFGLFS
eukprot:3104367-Amphidinium_carterae.1